MNDIFVLKKNSWHTKLMKFIWGYNYIDFPNMCPYFWLTVANICIVIIGCIPYLLYKAIKPIVKQISNLFSLIEQSISTYCNQRKKNWLDSFIDKLVANDINAITKLEESYKLSSKVKYDSKIFYYARYTTFSKSELKGSLTNEELDKVLILRENFKKWDILQAEKGEIREKFLTEQRKREQILKNEAIARRKKIGEITVKLQFLFKAIGIILGIGVISLVGYLLYKLFLLLSKVNYSIVLKYLGYIIVGVIALILAIGIIYGLVKFISFLWCKFGNYCIPCQNRRTKLSKFFNWLLADNLVVNNISNFFVWLAKGFKELFLIIQMLYKNNCPPIDWKD